MCLCAQRCTEDRVNADCPVCSAGGADLSACLGAAPAAALAAGPARAKKETVSYIKYWYDFEEEKLVPETLTAEDVTVVESSDSTARTTWEEGWYVVSGNVSLDARIEIKGDVHLILEDDCYMFTNKSIIVNEGSSLTIYGQEKSSGELKIDGNTDTAALGSEKDHDCGKIIIHGGHIIARAKSRGAGIGGGSGGAGDYIQIEGGTVKASGGTSGAGIGGGNGGSGGTITIYDGAVTATGRRAGAGIGGSSYGGTITIHGGTVNASSSDSEGYGAVGIGGSGSSGGDITITGGTVTATSSGFFGFTGDGINGTTFSTGTDGSAIIYASRIKAGGGPSQWSGIIFQGDSGQVYGNQTLTGDFTVKEDQTLAIPEGTSLTVPQDTTLTNEDTIQITGTGVLTNHGTLDNSSGLVTIAGDDSVVNDGTIIKGSQSAPAGGEGYTIDYEEETIAIDNGYEVYTTQDPDGAEIVSGGLSEYLGQTVYIRKEAYITQNASGWTELKIPNRRETPDAPQVTDRTDTSITIAAVDGAEYRLGADGSWQTGSDGSLTFGGLDAERTYTICARYAAVTSGDSPTFVSRETCIQAATKAAPGQAPVVSGVIVTDTTVTLPENAAWEYSTDGETWDSTHEFTGLDPATQYTYYVRERETDGAEASEIATVTVCTAYSAPADGEGYAIDYEKETLTVESGYAVNTAEDFTGTEIASGGSLAGCTGQTLYIRRTADDGGAPASAAVPVPIPARPAAPGVTGGILKIDGADTTMEYSTDQGAAWTAFTAETVSGISAGTYWVRYAAVAGTSFASERAEVTVSRRSSGGSDSEPSYSPILEIEREGTVKVSPRTPGEGDETTVTPTPDRGWDVGSVTVTDRNGREIDVTEHRNSTWTFEQPRGRVTIAVTFVPAGGTALFADVPEGYWAESAIRYVWENGLMNGTSAASFNPGGTVSRQQVWMILARMAGADPADMAAAKAWAVASGISDGTNPGGAVTRQQFAALLYRFAVMMGYDVSVGESTNILSYADAFDAAEYAIPALQWACGAGIINGTGDGSTLSPQGTATRAQAAVMLERFCELDK